MQRSIMPPDRIVLGADSLLSVEYFDSLDKIASRTCPLLQKGAIALSGGTTYTQLFPLWLAFCRSFPDASFFPVDDRVVPFEDPRSNWGTAYRHFLKPAGKESDKAHFASSEQQYRDILYTCFGSTAPVFDVIFLGVGDDGHTASLFPGSAYLNDRSSLVLSTKSPKPPVERITLAPGVIKNARHVVAVLWSSKKKKVWNG
ncbi:MAG: hypothetical protein GF350_00865, partial [Chitinivibrionales bacterium]|nr:hypothetical protein [Chitinivibrionales bacterium]